MPTWTRPCVPAGRGTGVTDPLKHDLPNSPRSVGFTRPHRVLLADRQNPLPLACGKELFPVTVEYEIYGRLSATKDNAVFIQHALSGDAHVAGWDREWKKYNRPWRKNRPGWWDNMVGPGKAFDTNRYFIVCANILGSCYGTTGPEETHPRTGRPYALSFPVVTVEDWVRLHVRLQDHLGIRKLLAVAGGSLGGQQALAWAMEYPERVNSAIILAAAPRLSAQGLAFNAVGRQAIINDPGFNNGRYYGERESIGGLKIARMLGHITYLSHQSMEGKFGRRFQNGFKPCFQLEKEFAVENYLEHQGNAFGERFDANSYLYISKAMDYYDAAARTRGDLVKACASIQAKMMLISFSSDWLYPPEGTREIARAMIAGGKTATYINLPSDYGHDAFLLEAEKMSPLVRAFLEGAERT